MMYAQPLCSKLGPERFREALELSKSVWNASNTSSDAIDILYSTAGRQSNLSKLIQLMVSRKERYFPDDTWIIRTLDIEQDPDNRLSIHITSDD